MHILKFFKIDMGLIDWLMILPSHWILTRISSSNCLTSSIWYTMACRRCFHSPRYVILEAVTAPHRLKMDAVIMTTTGLPTRSMTAPMNADTTNCATNTMLLTCTPAELIDRHSVARENIISNSAMYWFTNNCCGINYKKNITLLCAVIVHCYAVWPSFSKAVLSLELHITHCWCQMCFVLFLIRFTYKKIILNFSPKSVITMMMSVSVGLWICPRAFQEPLVQTSH